MALTNHFTIQQDGDRWYLWANDTELTRPQMTCNLDEALDILKVVGPIFVRAWEAESKAYFDMLNGSTNCQGEVTVTCSQYHKVVIDDACFSEHDATMGETQ